MPTFKNIDVMEEYMKKDSAYDMMSQEKQLENIEFSPATETEIFQTENRLGITLPKSYKIFVKQLGTPTFADNTNFINLEDLQVCNNCGNMSGMVIFATNVSDQVFLFKPNAGINDEYDVYLGDLNTGNCVFLADTFENWLDMVIDLNVMTGDDDMENHPFVQANYKLSNMPICQGCDLSGLKKYKN